MCPLKVLRVQDELSCPAWNCGDGRGDPRERVQRRFRPGRIEGQFCPYCGGRIPTEFVFCPNIVAAGHLTLFLSLVAVHPVTGADWTRPVAEEGIVYVLGGSRGTGSGAVRAGGKTGEAIYRERLPRTGGGGFGAKPCCASVVLAGGKLSAVSRTAGTFVLSAKPEYELAAHNRFESDQSDFNASPAISDGQMFLRSNRFLYCIGAE